MRTRRAAIKRIVAATAAAILLLTPTVLSFYSGGFFREQRLIAALIGWALVALAAVTRRDALPRAVGGRLAVTSIVALSCWTVFSLLELAPVAGPAIGFAELLLLFSGWLIAAAAFLRGRWIQLTIEPLLALGTLVVVGYALIARALPSVISSTDSIVAFGRLEQPVTYWNALGTIAATGVVICVRIAGDLTRPTFLRLAAAASSVPLALGIYLTYSRGALLAVSVGLAAILIAQSTRSQIRAAVICCTAGLVACFIVSHSDPIARLAGSDATRTSEGARFLAFLLVLMILTAFVQWVANRKTGAGTEDRVFRRGLPIAFAVAAAVVLIAAGASGGRREPAVGANTSRLVATDSDRYLYWNVAIEGWAQKPIQGIGAGGFESLWLADRTKAIQARNPHSLVIQTLSELGLIGLLFLATFFFGLFLSGRRARLSDPTLVAGWIAVLLLIAIHSAIDWVWQMPAVSLIGATLAGALIAEADCAPATKTPRDAAIDERGD